MGLDLSHGNFSHSYVTVYNWREEIRRAADIKIVFEDGSEYFVMDDEDILYILLPHSDCDGEIDNKHCAALADRLEELLPKMRQYQNVSQEFIASLREAAETGDNLEFM